MRPRELGAFFLTLVTGIYSGQASNVGDYAREFTAICRIIKLADSATAINVKSKTAVPDWPEQPDYGVRLNKIVQNLNGSQAEPIEIDGSPIILRPAIRLRVRMVLEALMRKMARAESGIRAAHESAESKLALAKKEFLAVISGQEQPEGDVLSLGKTALATMAIGSSAPTRANACKFPGEASVKPGVSIPFDLMCLCVDQATGTHKVCGVDTVGYWAAKKVTTADGSTMWATLYTHCTALNPDAEFSPRGIGRAIDEFERHLGARVAAGTGSSGAPAHWILGLPVKATFACDGTLGAGSCVNYAAASCSTSCAMGDVQWLGHLRTAKRLLEEVDGERKKADAEIKKIEAIWLETEAYLIQANASLESSLGQLPPHHSPSATPITSKDTGEPTSRLPGTPEGTEKETSLIWVSVILSFL